MHAHAGTTAAMAQVQLLTEEMRTQLTTARIRIFLLLVLQMLCSGAAYAEDQTSNDRISEELSKQQEIYQARGAQRDDGYVVDRTLVGYTQMLATDFDRDLANLGPADRWLDIGAGQGRAILDYYTSRFDIMHVDGRDRRGKRAHAVGISIEDRRSAHWRQEAQELAGGKLQYFSRRPLEKYSLDEIGRFQIITDVIGGFSYTNDLSQFLAKVLSFLELNGSFYTLLQDVHTAEGTNRPFYEGAPYLTEIRNADAAEVKMCSWLKSITCAEVDCEAKPGWKPPIEAFRIRKVCEDIRVPALVLLDYEAGTPPQRRFRLKDSAASASADKDPR